MTFVMKVHCALGRAFMLVVAGATVVALVQ